VHGFLRYCVEMLVVREDPKGTLDLGEGAKRYSLCGFTPAAADRISRFIHGDVNSFLVRLSAGAPKTCETWRSLALEFASVLQAQKVALVGGGLTYDDENGYVGGYGVQWLIRSVFTAACRSQKIPRLRLQAASARKCEATPWQLLPGPDQQKCLSQAASASKCATASAFLAKVGFRGPPELLAMTMCLAVGRQYKAAPAGGQRATSKRKAPDVDEVPQCDPRNREFRTDCWTLPCNVCGGPLHYGSQEAAASQEARHCGVCCRRARPDASRQPERQRAMESAKRASRPTSLATAARAVRRSEDTGSLLKCGGCLERTLRYAAGTQRTAPRWCAICRKKKRPYVRQ